MMSALLPKADKRTLASICPVSAISGREQPQQELALFDHFVGELLQLQRHFQAERLGSLEVDDELEFARLHDRQSGGLLTLEDAADIDGGLAVRVGQARGVGHEAAGVDQLARSKDGGDAVLLRQSRDSGGGSLEERVAGDDQRPHIALGETGKGCVEIALIARLRNVKL